jgi:hypothetical protein
MAAVTKAPFNGPILATARTEMCQIRRANHRRPLLATALGPACRVAVHPAPWVTLAWMSPDPGRCGAGHAPRAGRPFPRERRISATGGRERRHLDVAAGDQGAHHTGAAQVCHRPAAGSGFRGA